MNYMFVFALGIGFAAGLRALTPPAVVAWAAHLGWLNLNNTPARLHGIDNRRYNFFAPRGLRTDRRSATSNAETNSAYAARSPHSNRRSLRGLPLRGEQSNVNHRCDSG